MNTIFQRRSIRKYENKSVEKEKIEKILKAAMQAPSAGNQQPWEFLVIENKETLKKLSLMSHHSKMTADAPLAIVLLINKEGLKYPKNVEQDMGAATENLLLQVVELGLGAVWLGVAPSQEKMDYIKSMFHLPENIEAFAIVPIGYPAEEKGFIDRFHKNKVHYENY